MKIFVFILAIFILAPIAAGQEPSALADSELKGKVNSVAYERTYLIRKRIHVDPAPVQIYLD